MSNPFVTVSVKCAECGKVRGTANHWFVLIRMPKDQALVVAGVAALYAVTPLRCAPASDCEFPACGESCLQRMESKILSGKPPCAG